MITLLSVITGTNKCDIVGNIAHASADLIDWCNVNQAEANASKLQVLIANEKIEWVGGCHWRPNYEPQVKLLCVHLDNKLNYNFHIDNIIKKATIKAIKLPQSDYLAH